MCAKVQPDVSQCQAEMKTALQVTLQRHPQQCAYEQWTWRVGGFHLYSVSPAVLKPYRVSYWFASPRMAQLTRDDFTHLWFGGGLEQCHLLWGLSAQVCKAGALHLPYLSIQRSCQVHLHPTCDVKCIPTCFLWTGILTGPLYSSPLSKTWSSGRICAAAHCSCSPLLFWKKA